MMSAVGGGETPWSICCSPDLSCEARLCSGGLSVRTLGCCWAAGASTSGWYGAGQGYRGGGKRVVAAGRNCFVGGMRLQLGMEWPFAGWRREEEVSRGGVSS
jgi:hypothetical protein